jgi:outer membrane protein assembly factor BamB
MSFRLNGVAVEYCAENADSGWSRVVGGIPTTKVEPLPGSDSAVVLWDFMHDTDRSFDNLVCIDVRGNVVWTARTPAHQVADAFVSFDIEPDGTLLAHTWSGYLLHINADTGQTISSEFAK